MAVYVYTLFHIVHIEVNWIVGNIVLSLSSWVNPVVPKTSSISSTLVFFIGVFSTASHSDNLSTLDSSDIMNNNQKHDGENLNGISTDGTTLLTCRASPIFYSHALTNVEWLSALCFLCHLPACGVNIRCDEDPKKRSADAEEFGRGKTMDWGRNLWGNPVTDHKEWRVRRQKNQTSSCFGFLGCCSRCASTHFVFFFLHI